MIPKMEAQLKEIEPFIDSHRVLVFYYKIACLYFGAGAFDQTIDYLNKIILRSLNEFHHEKTISLKLQNHIKSVEILFYKGLYKSKYYTL